MPNATTVTHPFEVRISRRDGVVIADVQGPVTVANIARMIAEIEAHTRESGCVLALADLLRAEGTLSFTDQFRVSELGGIRLRHLDRLASAVRPQHMTGIARKIANRHGLSMRTFGDAESALRWLTSPAD